MTPEQQSIHLTGELARLQRELEQERELADRLANELSCLANWREAYGADCHYDPKPLDDWRKSRDEAGDPP